MRKTALAPGQLLRSVHMEKSYLGKASNSRCCTKGNPPLEVALRQQDTHVNSYRRQTEHRGKVDPGVSEFPLGSVLSRDHVNRPLRRGEGSKAPPTPFLSLLHPLILTNQTAPFIRKRLVPLDIVRLGVNTKTLNISNRAHNCKDE